MSDILNTGIPLSEIVKSMAMSTYEDYTKVKSTYAHFAAKAWDEINRHYIGGTIEKGIFPVHQSLKTVSIPLCAKEILYVGLIDDCGYKVPLTNKTNIAGIVTEYPCVETCEECNQPKDICAQLVSFPTEETVVNIDGQDRVNTATKYFENGVYFIKKTIWVKDVPNNTVKEVVATEFIEEFDILECGCIAPTETNISKIKESCFSCYCSCYAPCRESEYDLGGYKVFQKQGFIQLDKNVPYENVYLEWRSGLPRVNGELVVPEEAKESVLQGGIFFSTQHKKSVSLSERQLNFEYYKIAKKNMQIERCRMSIDVIKNAAMKIPKFDLSVSGGGCGYFSSNNKATTPLNIQNTVFIPPPAQVSGKDVLLYYYSGIQDATIFNEKQLLNKKIVGAFKAGNFFKIITTGVPNGMEVLYTPSVSAETSPGIYENVARFEWGVSFMEGELAAIQYY